MVVTAGLGVGGWAGVGVPRAVAVAVWVAAARWGQAIEVATMEAAVGVALVAVGMATVGVAMHTKYNEVPKRILGP